MSLIINLMKDEEEISVEVYRDEDFHAVLKKASALIGFEVDVKCLTGRDDIDLGTSVYDYFMEQETAQKAAPEEDADMIRIIELSDAEDAEVETKPEIKNEIDECATENVAFARGSRMAIDVDVGTANACFVCDVSFSSKNNRKHYVFDEKNPIVFDRNAECCIVMEAKLICDTCLINNFVKLEVSLTRKLLDDEYIVLTDGVKAVYKVSIGGTSTPRRKRKPLIETVQTEIQLDNVEPEEATEERIEEAIEGVEDPTEDVPNFVVRRKINKRNVASERKEAKKSSKIKRKLEMDGTISEIRIPREDNLHVSKIPRTELICRCCGLQCENLNSVIYHSRTHQSGNKGIPCILCLRHFKSLAIIRRHVMAEHQTSETNSSRNTNLSKFQKIKDRDKTESDYIKTESLTRYNKKEECVEETEEVDLTDRLHKYLSGELDADTFFQQEYYKSDPDNQIGLEDDDDLEVWIVQAENPDDEDGSKEREEELMTMETETIENEPEDELAFLNTVENEADNVESVDQDIVEAFQEVDYFEDPEYIPENDNDGDDDSIKSIVIEKRSKKKWGGGGKIRCEHCNKSYSTQLRLDQHKCNPLTASEDKKDDTTCSICRETFLSKVRLQFHRQTHREGGWQHMSCEHCGRKDFGSESELFDHIYFSHSQPFTCPIEGCTKTFKLKKLLKAHMRDHGLRKYVCDICNQRFQVHQTLKEHRVLHLKVKPFQCHICQKYMSKASRLRMHLLVHTSQQNPSHVLVCKLCDGAFKDIAEAEAHCDNPYDCEPKEEDREGVFDEDLYEEMGIQILSPTRFYNDDEDVKSGWRKNSSIKEENSVNDPLEASNEGPTLSSKHNILMQLSTAARKLITAVWIDKVYSCQYCEKVYYTKEALHQHRLIHSEMAEPYQCHLCEARFLTYARCTAHKSTHGYFKEGGAPSLRDFPVVKHYLCDLCDKSNLLWTTVSVHFRHHHKYNVNRRSPPSCKSCHTQFNTSWELGKHRRVKHRKDVHANAKAPIKVVNYSYKCLECDHQLPNKAALTSHRKAAHCDTEGGKKTKNAGILVCSECGKTYATKPALLTHIKWHTEHGVGIEAARRRKRAFGKGNHICSTCGLGFYSAANLRSHIERIHERSYKFTCEECGKGHFTHVEMETHKLTHTGERPYKCPDCPRAYVTKAILNKHYRNHTGERPYSCDVCGMTFKTAHSRNYHKLKHENGKIPAPLVVLEVTGGSSKTLQAALHDSIRGKGSRTIKHYSEDDENIKEEIEEFHQEVNEEEVLIRTSEIDESDDNMMLQEENSEGVQIVYKVKSFDDGQGCAGEFTIEYEEA